MLLMNHARVSRKHFGCLYNGDQAMHHQGGLWNSIWSDMMVETT